MHSESGVNSQPVSSSALVLQVDALPCKVPFASERCPPPLALGPVPALDLLH